MYGIPKRKRKISPEMVIKTLAEYHTHLSREQAILVLDMMYDFAKLAVNQQLRILSEDNSKLICRPGPGQKPHNKK